MSAPEVLIAVMAYLAFAGLVASWLGSRGRIEQRPDRAYEKCIRSGCHQRPRLGNTVCDDCRDELTVSYPTLNKRTFDQS